MQTVSEVMTRGVRFVSPQENLQHAAQMMGELDVGVLPVCDDNRLVGMLTDRDITIRSTAAGKSPQDARVEEVMSTDVMWCFEDQPLDEVMLKMADSQIRRVPVVSRDEQHTLIGIVALADLATGTTGAEQKQDVEQVVEMVSEPRHVSAGDFPTGRTGSVAGGGSKESIGQPMPGAGDSALGAGGASGAAGSVGTPPEAGGAGAGTGAGDAGSTAETRERSGVGGQDLTIGGLPPS
jgi:CBS domain-containing protein